MGRERGEGISGDFRPRGANDGNQSRFPDGRKAHEPDVGQNFQLDAQLALLAPLAGLREVGGGNARRRQGSVPAAAAAALRDDFRLAGAGDIGDNLPVRVINDRPERHANINIGPVATVAVLALTGGAVFRLNHLPIIKIDQSRKPLVADENNVSAAAAVPPGGSAFRHVFFPTICDDPATAVAGFHFNFHFIDKHFIHQPFRLKKMHG